MTNILWVLNSLAQLEGFKIYKEGEYLYIQTKYYQKLIPRDMFDEDDFLSALIASCAYRMKSEELNENQPLSGSESAKSTE